MTVEQEAPTEAAPHPEPDSPRRAWWRGARTDPYWLAGALFVAYTLLSVNRFRRMATMSWDLGIFEQAIRGYAHLQAPITDLKGPGVHVLSDHFSPVTALIAPFYRAFPTPVTLLVVQAALFALSVIPVTRVAGHFLGRGRGLAIGVAYGFSWGVQRAVDFDFHEVAFAMPLLAFSLEAVLRRRWTAAMWWAAPLVLVKEDLGATAAAIGLVVLLRARRDEPRVVPYAAGLMAFGTLASVVEVWLILPSFALPGFDALNHISGGADAGSITPDTALRTFLWVLLPTTGLLALRSPLLLVALPTFGWRALSGIEAHWGTDWHYNAVLMPIVILALVDAADRSRKSPRKWLRSCAAQLPAAAAAAALALTTTLPLADLTRSETYRPGPHVEAVQRLLERIPDGSTVEANVGPISRLTNRCRVFWIGDTRGVEPDYIAIDNASGWVSDPLEYSRQLHPAATYTQLGASGGYVVLRRE